MKRFFALLLASLLFATVVFCLAGCAGSYDISYGELYVYQNGDDQRTLVFNRDGTGVYTVKRTVRNVDSTVILSGPFPMTAPFICLTKGLPTKRAK